MKMKRNLRSIIFLLTNLCIICGAAIGFLFLRYPLAGSDYGLALPGLLDSALHFRLNGLTIQWYTPTLGGAARLS